MLQGLLRGVCILSLQPWLRRLGCSCTSQPLPMSAFLLHMVALANAPTLTANFNTKTSICHSHFIAAVDVRGRCRLTSRNSGRISSLDMESKRARSTSWCTGRTKVKQSRWGNKDLMDERI